VIELPLSLALAAENVIIVKLVVTNLCYDMKFCATPPCDGNLSRYCKLFFEIHNF